MSAAHEILNEDQRDCYQELTNVAMGQAADRRPCYDFTPIICPTFGGWLLKGYLTDFGCYKLSWCDGRCVQGPERIHRGILIRDY